MLKKFVLFITSFLLLFLILQIGSGMIVTTLYSPDMGDAWSQSAALPQETVVSGSIVTPLVTLLTGLVSAAAAYFIQSKIKLHSDAVKQ